MVKRLNHFSFWIVLGLGFASSFAVSAAVRAEVVSTNGEVTLITTNFLGWSTNGPAVLQVFRVNRTNLYSDSTNSPLSKLRRPNTSSTNLTFDHFQPASLNHTIWTNFLARTNGRDLRIWNERTFSEGWLARGLVVKWNTNSLVWGLRGFTALSPAWESGGGQAPVTALTRRHGYTRGHGMGSDGFTTNRIGQKVWFLTANNFLVEVRIKQTVVRTRASGEGDYTIILFDQDLPRPIEPMRVIAFSAIQSKYPFPTQSGIPHPIFMTEQAGYVSSCVPPLIVDIWKGGDSGSPNMLPLPGELVFFGGRSTTGPTREMQADMDALCRMGKLNPRKYQLQWVDLSDYPGY